MAILSTSITRLMMCWPLNAKSLIRPFNFPQAIMLPENETVPMINPRKMMSIVVPSKVEKNEYPVLA